MQNLPIGARLLSLDELSAVSGGAMITPGTDGSHNVPTHLRGGFDPDDDIAGAGSKGEGILGLNITKSNF